MIALQGGASEPSDTLLPGKAGGAVAVRRTLTTTICRVADPTQVPRPRQLRDASTVMRFRPAYQSMINRRHDGRASCLARQSLKLLLPMEPRIHAPATWKGGHESGVSEIDTARQRIELPPEEAADLRRRLRASTVSVRERRRSEIILSHPGFDAADRRTDGHIAPAGGRLGRTFAANGLAD